MKQSELDALILADRLDTQLDRREGAEIGADLDASRCGVSVLLAQLVRRDGSPERCGDTVASARRRGGVSLVHENGTSRTGEDLCDRCEQMARRGVHGGEGVLGVRFIRRADDGYFTGRWRWV